MLRSSSKAGGHVGPQFNTVKRLGLLSRQRPSSRLSSLFCSGPVFGVSVSCKISSCVILHRISFYIISLDLTVFSCLRDPNNKSWQAHPEQQDGTWRGKKKQNRKAESEGEVEIKSGTEKPQRTICLVWTNTGTPPQSQENQGHM